MLVQKSNINMIKKNKFSYKTESKDFVLMKEILTDDYTHHGCCYFLSETLQIAN